MLTGDHNNLLFIILLKLAANLVAEPEIKCYLFSIIRLTQLPLHSTQEN